MGDTVNLAARLMAAASPGSILATPGVLERSRTRFAVSALPPFTVKGKSKPVEAYSVESPIVDRGTDPVALLPLVGRADEMTTLASALEALASGRGAVVEIVSEAGLGRTRIAEELRSRAGTTQLAWTNGGPYAAGTPYFPFRSLLSDVLGIGAGEPVSVARALEDLAAAEAPEVLPWLPLVGLVLNVAVQSTPETDALDPSFRRAQLERAVVDLVSAHVRAPAVFVFEDVHFFDDASAGLLEALGVAALDRPWLVVSTRSEGWRANTRALSGATLLALEPLRRDDARQLAEVAAGSAALSDHDLDAIANRSGGNPLVIRELVAAVAGKEDVEGLPETVEALMTARIDRLPPRDRILLRTASVLGTVFDAPMLAGLLDEGCPDPGDPVWTRLARYVRGQGGVYRFASPIIRDVAYEGLTYRARKTLHERAGETMLRSGENDRIEVLALHFSSAGRHPEAWRFGREAGDRARSKYAHIEAARFFERALASARRLEVPSSDVAATHESLGDALAAAGEFRRAERSYADGRHIAATDVPTAVRLLMKEAQIADRLGRFTLSLRRLTRGQHALGAAPSEEAARLRPKLSMWYAAVLQQQGRHREAIRWCTKTLEEAGAVDDRHALAYAHQILDWALASVGEDAGHEHLRIALELYEEIGDLKGQAVALNNLGAAEYFAGRWDAAVELYERSRSAHERIGDPVGATMGMVNVAEIMSDQGRLDEAEPLLVRALRIGKASGHRVGAAFAMGQLARVAARAGRFDDAFALFKDVESEYLDLGDAASVTETRARIAESWVLAGDPDRALAALDEIGLPESGPSSSLRPLQLRTRGVALAQTGDFDGGRAALVASIEAARSHGSDHEEAIAAHWLARLAESQGSRDGDAARRSEEIFTRLHVVRAPDPPLHRLE
jgi:tetratricopeptide (TPR) repeat protein